MAEFASAELGARMGLTPWSARQLMGDVLDLHFRLPQTWARVEALEVKPSYARHVARRTRDLTREQAAYVDERVHEAADGRIPWTRFEALVEAAIVAADPKTAREAEEKASKATFAKRMSEGKHGMASLLVRADVATIEQIDAVVTAVAARLLEAMPDADEDARRILALLLLITGQLPSGAGPDDGQGTNDQEADGSAPLVEQDLPDLADLLPTVQLFVHLYGGLTTSSGATVFPDHTGIARVEGHGPVTEEWVRRVLGPKARFKVTPVLDIEGQAPVDSYEIPDRHRQAVRLMTPADIFPFASSISRSTQIDHTIPFDSGGPSEVGNYGPMTTLHHRIKTFGLWQVKQPYPGVYIWRDPTASSTWSTTPAPGRCPATTNSRPDHQPASCEGKTWRVSRKGAQMATPTDSMDARELVAQTQRELAETAEAIRSHRFLEKLRSGEVPEDRLRSLAAEQLAIVSSDRRSFAQLATRFPGGLAGEFFLGMAEGEGVALQELRGFASWLGVTVDELGDHHLHPGAQAYPAFVAWLALNGSRSDVVLAFVANLAAWGENCGAVAAALRETYRAGEDAVEFFEFFATPPDDFEPRALAVIDEGLAADDSPLRARRATRLLQAYELSFWDALAEGL